MENFAENLFESAAKVRILRIFMQNPDAVFPFPDIVKKSKVKSSAARSILVKFLKLEVAKKKIAYIRDESAKKQGKKKPPRAKKAIVYYANKNFSLFSELRDLIVNSSVASRKKLLQKIQKLGNVKLVVISGVFIRNDGARTDLLIVGDKIASRKLNDFLSSLESELGKTIRYTLMDTKEFRYRMDMYDRFLRDILEFPHEKLINRLGI